MCHTVQYRNTTIPLLKKVIGTIAICLQMTSEVFEHLLWTFSSSARLIVKEDQPVYAVMVYPIETSVCFSLLILVQYFDRGLISMQIVTGYHFFSQSLIQGLDQPAAIMYPICKGSISNRDVFPGKTLLLAVQGQVIQVFVYDGLC